MARIKIIKIPKTEEPGVYGELHKSVRPEGSTKNLGNHYVRKTFVIRKSLLQKLEDMAYWEKEKLFQMRDEMADERISVSDMLVQILKKHFKENPVKEAPDSEYLDRLIKLRNKIARRTTKRVRKGKGGNQVPRRKNSRSVIENMKSILETIDLDEENPSDIWDNLDHKDLGLDKVRDRSQFMEVWKQMEEEY